MEVADVTELQRPALETQELEARLQTHASQRNESHLITASARERGRKQIAETVAEIDGAPVYDFPAVVVLWMVTQPLSTP